MEQELKLLEWIGIGTDISCSGQLCNPAVRGDQHPEPEFITLGRIRSRTRSCFFSKIRSRSRSVTEPGFSLEALNLLFSIYLVRKKSILIKLFYWHLVTLWELV